MDLDTENRLAAILMREAAELRRQSEKEGVLAYLRQPNARSRPNSRFLTATVLGVQQANRSVEVNEMWRVRQKEIELDKRVKGRLTDKSSGDRSRGDDNSSRSTGRHAIVDNSTSASASCSSKRGYEHCPEGLNDDELEEFLYSRTKRGRGAVGPRMDETGPYLPRCVDETGPYLPRCPDGERSACSDVREPRVVYGPERPSSLKSYESSEEEELHEKRRKKAKKSHGGSSEKEHSKQCRTKHKSKQKKKKRKEKRSKHH